MSRACSGCATRVLGVDHTVPVLAHHPATWEWKREMLTVNGVVLHREAPEAQDDDGRTLDLPGIGGRVTPSTTPQRLRAGQRTFANSAHRLSQDKWYKVVGDRVLCAPCFVDMRRVRRAWKKWARGDLVPMARHRH